MKVAARNIATGLIKNDRDGKKYYLSNLKSFRDEIDRRLFGDTLIEVLGGEMLCELAEQGKLIPFLKEKELQGKPLIDSLGGWLQKMLPLYGTPIVTYHKNWIYFVKLFGLDEAGTVEPKPGIPPSPKHVAELIRLMSERNIRILLSANYFDEHQVNMVAQRVNAQAVIVPLYVGGVPEVTNYFQLADYWTDALLKAANEAGILK